MLREERDGLRVRTSLFRGGLQEYLEIAVRKRDDLAFAGPRLHFDGEFHILIIKLLKTHSEASDKISEDSLPAGRETSLILPICLFPFLFGFVYLLRGLYDRIGVQGHALYPLPHEEFREVRHVARPLPANADVFLPLLRHLDDLGDQFFH